MKNMIVAVHVAALACAWAPAYAGMGTRFDARGHSHAVVYGRVGHKYLDLDIDNGDCKVGPFVVDESPTKRLLDLKAGEDFPPGCSKASAAP